MYKIIGADNRPYGPVAADQIKIWIASNRANAQTMAQAEGAADWRPLGSYPEFLACFNVQAVPPFLGSNQNLRSKLAAGLFGMFLGGLGIHRFYLGYIGIGIAQILLSIFCLGTGVIWGFIEGVLILTGSVITTDADGQPLRD